MARCVGFRRRRWVLFGSAVAAAVLMASNLFAVAAGAADAGTVRLVWGPAFSIDHGQELTASSCVTPAFCVAVDNGGRALVFRGSKWSRPKAIDADPTGFTGVSCASETFCIATDTDGFASKWNGKSWSPPSQIDPTNLPEEMQLYVSCPTTTFCAGADSSGYLLTWNGRSWKRVQPLDRYGNAGSFNAVSCSTTSFCVAVGLSGGYAVFNGVRWTKILQSTSDLLNAVSCVGKFCMAVGDGATSYNGVRWSPDEAISSLQLVSVSCITSAVCTAGDALGYIYDWAGQRWHTGRDLSGDDALNSIVCRTAGFCSAVTADGNAVFYGAVPRITNSSLPEGTVHSPYFVRLRPRYGTRPYKFWPGGHLPKWLKLSRSGALSGTPPRAGAYNLKVVLVDALHISSTRTLKLVVRS